MVKTILQGGPVQWGWISEAYAFPHPHISSVPAHQFDEDNRVRELHWWGKHPPVEIKTAVAQAVLTAVFNADIIGFPSIYRVIRDISPKTLDIGSSRSLRGLVTVLDALGTHIRVDHAIFTEERCHQVLFDATNLRHLASLADRVVLVSCWSKQEIVADFLEYASFIQIPPHTKVRDTDEDHTALFERYEDIDAQVADLSRPGVLVLVAGGLIGKIFLDTARSRGAVALDIGSVIDYMAGRKTRSIIDMV